MDTKIAGVTILGAAEDIINISGNAVRRLSVIAQGDYFTVKTLANNDLTHAGITYVGFRNIDKVTENTAAGTFVLELSQIPQSEATLRADIDYLLIMVEG